MPWGASFQTAGSCASVSGGSVVTCLSPWQREHRRGVGGLADSRPVLAAFSCHLMPCVRAQRTGLKPACCWQSEARAPPCVLGAGGTLIKQPRLPPWPCGGAEPSWRHQSAA